MTLLRTLKGLSQHERHTHPKIRNAVRAAEARKTVGRATNRLNVWTEGELVELERQSLEMSGERNINIKLMKYFPGKTNKQISDARRRFKPKVGTSLSPPEMALQEQVTQAFNEISLLERRQATQECNRKAAVKVELQKTYDVPDKWVALAISLTGNTEMDGIDTIHGDLVAELTRDNKHKRDKASTRRGEKRKDKTRPPKRSERRRYAFARCQELMMNKYPRKLADAVAANDLSLLQIRQEPNMIETRNLYVNLWGIFGPRQKPTAHSATAVQDSELLLSHNIIIIP